MRLHAEVAAALGERKEILRMINDELLRLSMDHGESIMDFGSIAALEDLKRQIIARYHARPEVSR
jgi:hypothetical protein